MPKDLDHIGIAVQELEGAISLYVEGLGLELKETETVESENVRVAMLLSGKTRVELLEPLDDSSAIGQFLAQGKKGIHHLAFRVENIEEELALYRAKGVRVIEPAPRVGAGGCKVAFIHPKSTAGVLIELVERPK
jgi:methylmalonyl-CoA/ethylmalonyl-CoA epimerase